MSRPRRFILLVDKIDVHEETLLALEIQQMKCEWWHWISGCWLLVAQDPAINPSTLRDMVNRIAPTALVLVIGLNDPPIGKQAWTMPLQAASWLAGCWAEPPSSEGESP